MFLLPQRHPPTTMINWVNIHPHSWHPSQGLDTRTNILIDINPHSWHQIRLQQKIIHIHHIAKNTNMTCTWLQIMANLRDTTSIINDIFQKHTKLSSKHLLMHEKKSEITTLFLKRSSISILLSMNFWLPKLWKHHLRTLKIIQVFL